MAIFNYSAYKDGSQEILTGKVEAIDIRSARAEVRNLGLTAISVTEETAKNFLFFGLIQLLLFLEKRLLIFY